MSEPVSVGSADRRLAAIALLCASAVAAALVSQHRFEMEPCPWCILQRVIFIAIGLAAALGLVWRRAAGRLIAAILVILLAVAGIAAALWQHFYAAPSGSCNLTLADRMLNALSLPSLLPDVFSPRASCADAVVDLLGIPYDFWSLGLFIVLGAIAASVLARPRTRHTAVPRSA